MFVQRNNSSVRLGRRFGGEGEATPETSSEAPEEVLAFVLTRVPGYVPEGVSLRERSSSTLFTAAFPRHLLPELRRDAKVARIEESKEERTISPRPAALR